MISLATVGALVGGIGLFLLGMWLMTEGLKLAAGSALENILAKATKTRVRGLISGIVVTAIAQSSSAVTVATIGFVNAGLLGLSQAIWVLFGANVGTTMTGWLVSLVGFKFNIAAIALPLVGLGMLLRLTGENTRRAAAGMALAGFGVLFLGIDGLTQSFSGISKDFALPPGDSFLQTLSLVGIGALLTVLMQSSSASLALAITATAGGVIGLYGGGALVIGANIGTTITALIAAVGATSNAKRAAAAHIVFNLVAGVIAMLLLQWTIPAIASLGDTAGLENTAKLALFHTAFNLIGVLAMWPLANRLIEVLATRFRAAEEDLARPRFIDNTVLVVPELALDALAQEIRRMGEMSSALVCRAFVREGDVETCTRDRAVLMRLNLAVSEFIAKLHRAIMTSGSADRLPRLLALARHYTRAAELAAESVAILSNLQGDVDHDAIEFRRFRECAFAVIASGGINRADAPQSSERAESEVLVTYDALKAKYLADGAQGRLGLHAMDNFLRAISALRNATHELAKAAKLSESTWRA